MGSSVSNLTESAQGDLQRTAVGSISLFTRIFTQGRAEGTLNFAGNPQDAATAFLAMMQGLQTLARAKNDLDSFHRSVESYIETVTS
jgi:hypothetical protein